MIRKAVRGDAGRVAEILIMGSRAAYQGIVLDTYLRKSLVLETRTIEYEERIKSGIEGIFVSEEDGVTHGFFACARPDKFRDSSLELLQIYVDPRMKRKGIGGALLAFFEDLARTQHFDRVFLWVIRDNCAGRMFYEKNGYAKDALERMLEKYQVPQVRYSKNV